MNAAFVGVHQRSLGVQFFLQIRKSQEIYFERPWAFTSVLCVFLMQGYVFHNAQDAQDASVWTT